MHVDEDRMKDQDVAKRPKSYWPEIIIGFLSFPIIAILVFQILMFGFTNSAKCRDEEGFFRKLVCGIRGTCESDAPYFRFLPSDEKMISHFRRHRADFERLVQIYQKDASLPTRFGLVGYDEPPREVKAIMARINVNGMRSDWTIWMPPDPYSEVAQQQVRRLGLVPKLQRGYPEARKFSGVLISYAHPPVIRFDKDLSNVRKGYYYTPFPPRVENGLLKKPDGGGETLFPTLNTYPSRLITGDCVYRQFEPQWFISMCQ
jgi:hypothetical protein